MTDKIGPSFYSELAAAGVSGAVAWNAGSGTLTRCVGVSDDDFAKAQAILAKHDPTKSVPAAAVVVSGAMLFASLPRNPSILWDALRLKDRAAVPATNLKLKRIADEQKTTPDALLAAAAKVG